MEGTTTLDTVGGVDPDQLKTKCAEYGTPRKGDPVFHEVFCTLEELFIGKTRDVKGTGFCGTGQRKFFAGWDGTGKKRDPATYIYSYFFE